VFKSIRNMLAIPELRQRIFFTLAILFVYRIGGHIPSPGVNAGALSDWFSSQQGGLFGFFDMFAGGNLRKATIFALGIMPYITASIIFQLLTAVIPSLEKLQKEGEAGRKKITQYTRYATIALALLQSFGISVWLQNSVGAEVPGLIDPALGVWGFRLLAMITMTAGTAFIMWLGEQITERGIGNGISLIIFIGIVARIWPDVQSTIGKITFNETNIVNTLILLIVMVLVVAGVVMIQQGQRRIRVQYAKRIVGRKVYGGQTTHIPLRVNTAGVIPIIFASALIMLPNTILMFTDAEWLRTLQSWLMPGEPLYMVLYAGLIIFFSYFYTAIVLNPADLADNIKKYGGFIPGIKPGKKTEAFIDRILTRITLAGSVFLAVIALLPIVMSMIFQAPFSFGGTGLLIVVGVALDTMRQIESHMLMRHYDGFLKKGRIRGRR
jgi:preprotein translocase subunit SecY